MTNNLRSILRQRTAGAHRAVDETVGVFHTLDDYQNYLPGMAAFRQAIEAALAGIAWPSLFGDWRPQPIANELMRDLADLRLPAPDINLPLPALNEPASLLGVAYVLEGSSLGAKILYQRALGIGLDETFGARHLAKQSSATGWKTFLPILDRAEGEASPPLPVDGAVAAALATFNAARLAFQITPKHVALQTNAQTF